jgi:hypothetical protein
MVQIVIFLLCECELRCRSKTTFSIQYLFRDVGIVAPLQYDMNNICRSTPDLFYQIYTYAALN